MTTKSVKQSLSLACLLLACTTFAHANSLDISLNQDVAQVKFHAGTDLQESEQGGFKAGILYNEDKNFMLFGTYLVPSEGSNGFQVSPGIKFSYIDLDKVKGDFNSTLALGLRLSGAIPVGIPLSAYGALFYAPSVTSFDQVESSLDTEFGLKLHLSENASIYAGYRRISVDLEDLKKDVEIDDKAHLGLIFSF